jgi:hypothetical protein
LEKLTRVDETDHAPCDLRCTTSSGHYCAAYPDCAAGALHQVQDPLMAGPQRRRIVRTERMHSRQGGYSLNRIIEDPASGATVEEVELHCRTLTFEAVVQKGPAARYTRPAGAGPSAPGAQPDGAGRRK